MVLGLIKKEKPKEVEMEEYIEISPEEVKEEKKIYIRVEKIKDETDVVRIQKYLREGYIVFASIKEIKQRDLSELKRVVEKLKKTIVAMDGDMIGAGEDFLVLTPSFARVYRGMPQPKS